MTSGDQTTSVPQATGSAFALGWNVAELSSLLGADDAATPEWVALPLTGDLTREEHSQRLVRRIEVRLQVLRAAWSAPASRESAQQAVGPLLDEPSQQRLRAFHLTVSSVLMAEDSRLGKAYALGVTLWDIGAPPAGGTSQPWYDPDRVRRAKHYLADLHTVLPDHAAMGVRGSLSVWETHAGELTWAQATTLGEQTRTWRALLSGEKSPTQQLDAEDYAFAGRRGLAEAKQISGSILGAVFGSRASRAVVAALAGLVIAGVVVALLAPGIEAAGVIVSLVSGTGALGFAKKAWDGVAGMWDDARPAIMDAALDLAVASAVTQLPPFADGRALDEPTLRADIQASLHPSGLAPRPQRARRDRGA